MIEFDLAQNWYWLVIGAVVSYFIGCFHFALLIAKIKHEDILNEGSGNPGAMNVSRKLGFKYGIINFACDALKGVVPVLVGYFCFRNMVFKGTDVLVSDFMCYFFALFAVLGHVFPVFMKFKGGKGISTTIGLLWCAVTCTSNTWWFVFVGLALFISLFVYVYFTEWGAMASLIGVSGFSIWQLIVFILRYQACLLNVYVIILFVIILALNVITWGAHNKNLHRLLQGEEHHTSLKKMWKKGKKS
ncbi:MAG: glycerol-3-phosphate acyltransferase [Candidatus Coproplasma sp.]